DEAAYAAAARAIVLAYRQETYARVAVDRRARVDLDTHTATVDYTVRPGPRCVFGTVDVTGTEDVDPEVVRAEIAFHEGEAFSEAALDRTRTQLQATQLFNVVRIREQPGTSPVLDVTVDVREAPPHAIRLGVGYDTDQGPRGIAGWRHYNFYGGGR